MNIWGDADEKTEQFAEYTAQPQLRVVLKNQIKSLF